jgi:hypothetical protein
MPHNHLLAYSSGDLHEAQHRPHLEWLGHTPFHARDGRFELHGLDLERSTPVYLLDIDHKWGATVELSGKQSGEEVTVRLQPCGQAKVRFIGPGGKPVAKLALWPYFELLMKEKPEQQHSPYLVRRADAPHGSDDAGR